MGNLNIGVDVGGTFTDFILIDAGKGEYRTAKVPTTLHDRSAGFMQGLAEVGARPADIDLLVHGTTAGTNAVLERKGARCGLITTMGFRDVLELGRRTRPYAYGLSGSFEPLIARRYRLEVHERIDARGNVLVPLNEDDVREAVARLKAMDVDSIVIHFLHSYVNPEHEARCARLVRTLWHNDNVIAGHEIIRELREFERGSTAAIHASIRPIVTDYILQVNKALKTDGFRKELLIMQANGGMMASSLVGDHAVQTIMSGPAGGVLAAARIARAAGLLNVITGDMGGTSYDVALIVDGEPVITAEKDLAYSVPIRIPMIDIHSIGAGGGSIAQVDKAGMLRVGPQSAGSDPGPIGYGRGGTRPTITDANFLLGRLNPNAITGSSGHAPLDRIADAMEQDIGRHLGLDALETAAAIIDVAVNDLAGAIRLISIDKGHDPRDFALMPYGGAGPLHVVAIARELGIPRIIIPRFPGLTSALGCIMADVRHDYVQTLNKPLATLDTDEVEAIKAEHEARGRQLLEQEQVALRAVEVRHDAELLYRGQSHVLRIPLPAGQFDSSRVEAAFAQAYLTRFGLALPEMVPMLVNLRTTVTGVRAPVDLNVFRPTTGTLDAALTGTRAVYFDGAWHETCIYQRERLPLHAEFSGPAIIEQADSTIVLEPGIPCRVDEHGNLLAEVGTIPAATGTDIRQERKAS